MQAHGQEEMFMG